MSGHPILAALYDRLTAAGERGGVADLRRELLVQARGRTLEIGAGTGHNLPHYTETVTELVLTEPDPHMAKRLREHLSKEPPRPRRVEVIETGAEALPFDDGSFDTVVATLVFCTIPDPRRAAAEARRVLVEGGALLYLEHVRGESARVVRWQNRLRAPWSFFAGGCQLNRPTGDTLAAAGFWMEHLERGRIPKAPFFASPMIRGVARRPGPAGELS